MAITRKDIPKDEMPLKIPDHILLKEANVENGKLRAYIDELEDTIKRLKVNAFTEIDIDLEWISSSHPKESELKKEIVRLGAVISGNKPGLEKEVQTLKRKLSIFEECGNMNDVMSAICNMKALAKRVSKLEKENAKLKAFIRANGLNYNTVINESSHP